ncbi:MAG: C4-dicarboxylate TRAP transporter substrate-binding protein [Alphaproteobacteria bacterium]|jgi:TRAP-type C4-dicarboxylate transport system substrate-binding protein|nr:C4-dicarboxylate TRAP transporter substrate-binding protein [Alphaproteobacteria bacterium]MDP6256470.1 C4-dicarboxylate TRAP transporter substrate-binding protein [Alphaproteobacteria bacterium]
MLKLALCGAIAAAAFFATPISIQSAEAKVYNLRYADIGPPRGPRAAALMWWADELEKRSGGDIKIKFFWSQSLVKGKATMKAVGSGLSDMGTILGVYSPAELPIWNFSNTPFLVSDTWVGMRTWHELRQVSPELNNETNRQKITILFNNTTGPVQLLSTKSPITSIADLKGKKIRATGGWTHLFKALGAVPVKIGFGELYAALDRGTIDGTVNYTPYVKSYKHYEVASHLTEASMGQLLGYGGGINTKLFKSMPKKLQDILVKTSDEYMDVYAKNYITDSDAAKKAMTAGIDGRKVMFHQLSSDERAKWQAAAASFEKDWIAKMTKKGVDAAGFIAKFDKIHAKYKKIVADKGYPWATTN